MANVILLPFWTVLVFLYLKIIYLEKKRVHLRGTLKKFFYVLKILLYVSLILFFYQVRTSDILQPISEKIVYKNVTFQMMVLAFYLPLFRLKIIRFYSKNPFWFFNKNWIFKIKSVVYPIISSTFSFFLLISLCILFGFKGVWIFTGFYLFYFFSASKNWYQTVFGLYLALIYIFQLYDNDIFSIINIVLLVASLIVFFLKKEIRYRTAEASFISQKISSIYWKKEFLCWKYYKSDLFFLSKNTLYLFVCPLLLFSISKGETSVQTELLSSLYPVIIMFSSVISNLLGTETGFLNRLLRNKEQFWIYFNWRSSLYAYLIFVLSSILGCFYVILWRTSDLVELFIFVLMVAWLTTVLTVFFRISSARKISIKDCEYEYNKYYKDQSAISFMLYSIIFLSLLAFLYEYLPPLTWFFANAVSIPLVLRFSTKVTKHIFNKREYEFEYN